jgi:hypothetical protein
LFEESTVVSPLEEEAAPGGNMNNLNADAENAEGQYPPTEWPSFSAGAGTSSQLGQQEYLHTQQQTPTLVGQQPVYPAHPNFSATTSQTPAKEDFIKQGTGFAKSAIKRTIFSVGKLGASAVGIPDEIVESTNMVLSPGRVLEGVAMTQSDITSLVGPPQEDAGATENASASGHGGHRGNVFPNLLRGGKGKPGGPLGKLGRAFQ